MYSISQGCLLRCELGSAKLVCDAALGWKTARKQIKEDSDGKVYSSRAGCCEQVRHLLSRMLGEMDMPVTTDDQGQMIRLVLAAQHSKLQQGSRKYITCAAGSQGGMSAGEVCRGREEWCDVSHSTVNSIVCFYSEKLWGLLLARSGECGRSRAQEGVASSIVRSVGWKSLFARVEAETGRCCLPRSPRENVMLDSEAKFKSTVLP